MSYTPDQLLRFATKYAQLASEDLQKVDIEQPENFDEDYEKYKQMQEDKKPKMPLVTRIIDDLPILLEEGAELALADDDLEATAAKKEKKLDPKAKVRNRGTVCVPAEQAKDKKDHFPINDEGQARNALARVQQLSSAPWYKGSLEGLKALVARKVKAKYPKIDVGGKKKEKKSSLTVSESILLKYAK